MKTAISLTLILLIPQLARCWGFFGHRQINHYAVFLLPPEMLLFYKPHLNYITDHSVDPDKRRYAVKEEGPRHYIDLDKYGNDPRKNIPLRWNEAVDRFSADTLNAHGIAPWWIQTMLYRLTNAFRDKNQLAILKLSSELGHYIGDIHVPLHASSNHNGQHTGQHGIHGFWESRIPELLAEKEWDFFIGKAGYIDNPAVFIWDRAFESAAAADTVLRFEKKLSQQFPGSGKYAFEERNGTLIRQYSSAYTIRYNRMLNNMVERRMRQSIYAVASFWYTAWVNAGQPELRSMAGIQTSEKDSVEIAALNFQWRDCN